MANLVHEVGECVSDFIVCVSQSYLEVCFEQREKNDFWMKCNFSKIRIGHVMLNFLVTTENLKNVRSEQPNNNLGKVIQKTAGTCFSQFPDILSY